MKQFLIFKETEKNNDKSPDYNLMAKIDDKLVKVGAGWIRTSQKGTSYISCQLSNPFKDMKGFHLEVDKDNNEQAEIDYQKI